MEIKILREYTLKIFETKRDYLTSIIYKTKRGTLRLFYDLTRVGENQ